MSRNREGFGGILSGRGEKIMFVILSMVLFAVPISSFFPLVSIVRGLTARFGAESWAAGLSEEFGMIAPAAFVFVFS
jgi:hypothetical protein